MGERRLPGQSPCPCCGHGTLPEEPPGTCCVCPGRFWEDDHVQFDDPSFRGGANVVSLEEALANFRRFGASEERAGAAAGRAAVLTQLAASEQPDPGG